MSEKENQIAKRPFDVQCPRCNALPQEYCHVMDGSVLMNYFHVAREVAALGEAAPNRVCQWCGCDESKHYGGSGCHNFKNNGKWIENCKCAEFSPSETAEVVE